MITGPLFKWFGSKWSSSKYYPKPKYDSIFEPFAGSAGYSLRYSSKNITLAESNEHIRKLWKWLIETATEQDIRSIPINISEGTDIRQIGLNEGQALLLKNWQRTNNVGDCWTISKWGNLPGQWTENTRSRVATEFHFIKHWKIIDDAFKLIEQHVHDKQFSTWFVDPMYQYNYQYRSELLEYHDLGQTLLKLPGQLIVCEAACQITGQLPKWLPFVDFKKTVTSRRKTSNNHHSRELIFVQETRTENS